MPTGAVVTAPNRYARRQAGTCISPTPCPHRQPWSLPPAGRKANTMPAKRTAFLLRSVRRGRTACSVGNISAAPVTKKYRANPTRRLRPAGLGRLIFLRLTQYHQLDVKVYGDQSECYYVQLGVWHPSIGASRS